ncbi:MAG: ATP-binding protein [Cyclobacteriaceae bacterium]|nr:ATP-binding protein [Flammeovirgaceae bacterium]
MVTRDLIQTLRKSLKQFPAVVLLGPRQIGKSTLALQLAGQLAKKSIVLDLEKRSDRAKVDDPEAFFKSHQDKLVIIDEAQTLPELFSSLRPAIDEHRKPGRFLLLGSASPQLVRHVSESLAGRVTYLELTSITLSEAGRSRHDLQTLWLRGGFPLALTARSDTNSLEWRQQLIRSFVERDLTLLFGVELSRVTIQNFWQMISHNQGGIWNAQTYANSLGVTGPTIKRYLQFMGGAFLVRLLEPWFVNTNKRLVKSPKVYVRDSGLLHAMLGLSTYTDLLGHPVAGGSWEGFVIEQITAVMPPSLRAFYYRTHHGAEADLVLVNGLKPVTAIEIKLNNAPVISKGFYQTLHDLGIRKGYVITPAADRYPVQNVEVMSLPVFIEHILPKL